MVTYAHMGRATLMDMRVLPGKFGVIDTVFPRYIYILPTIWPDKNGNINMYKIGGKDFNYVSGQEDPLFNL
jgi:hypothetical protein